MHVNIRDYSILGDEKAAASANGLVSAAWYTTPVPRSRLKELMRRSDGPAIRDTALWLGLLISTGVLGAALWGTWWAVPIFAVYGVLYGSATDARWHECGHGTAFKTRWMNDVVYQLASFMILRQPTPWRWSHTRHHTDTNIVGVDPGIAVPRPPDLTILALSVFALHTGVRELRDLALHAVGRISEEERMYIPESEFGKVYVAARIWVGIFAAVIVTSVAMGSFLPLVLVGLPTFYGAWFYLFTDLTQHAGLAEDTLDHRLNSRTVYMNPVFRFLYMNMNYHVEHHMFPMVPFHALPALHEVIKHDLPAPYPGMLAAYREIIPTLLRQRRDPTYFARRKLPPTARPFPAMAVAAE